MNRILVLGAGMVSKPLVTWLLHKNYLLTVADMDKSKADNVTAGHPNATTVLLDVKNEEELESLVAAHDIVVSLLPYTMHLLVVRFCIKHKKSMVTTSYQSAGMSELKTQIEESGITVLNEIGLDPGIDHMSARQIIDRVHAKQGYIVEFFSLCGALPSPEVAAENPMGYKFTWSPRGVMLAGQNDAHFLTKGEETVITADKLFHAPYRLNFPEVGMLEVYPNRDSISYITDYSIPEVKTMMRGTLRFTGWCETLDAMKLLGLLDTSTFNMENMTYFNLLERKVGTLYPEYECQIAKFLGVKETSVAIKSLAWLGFFSNDTIGRASDSPFNITCDLMFAKMMASESDKDMVVMQHELLVRYPGDREERIFSRLLQYGSENGDTAIALTVALPAAIAVHMLATGGIQAKGLLRPFMREIYEPILQELEKEGIKLTEEILVSTVEGQDTIS